MKHCPCCDETKPKWEFSKNRASKDGLQTWCKLCKRRADRSYYRYTHSKVTTVAEDEKFADVVVAIFDNAYEIMRDAVEENPEDWTFTAKDLKDTLVRVLDAIEYAEGIKILALEAMLK